MRIAIKYRLIIILCLSFIAVIAGLYYYKTSNNNAALQNQPFSFSLIDQEGREVNEKSWPGKYLLVFFGYTNCPDICPTTLQQITSILKYLGLAAEKIIPLFISVDPEHDTPSVLKTYTSFFDKRIIGLTGSRQQVLLSEKSYGVFAANTDTPGLLQHSIFAYLITPGQQLAELFTFFPPSIDTQPKIIAKKINMLLK